MKRLIEENFVTILSKIIISLSKIEKILESVNDNGKFYETEALLEVFNELFSSEELINHILYKVTLIGKSTQSLFNKVDVNDANKHIVLEISSGELRNFDELYENKISDLLKFFKHLFSLIENFSISNNFEKVKKYKVLLGSVQTDFQYLKTIQIDADGNQSSRDSILKAFSFLSSSTEKKENWQLYLKISVENKVEHLYHFTDISNIESIKTNGGLYSWHYCEINNLIINRPGGNEFSRELDKRKNLHNYVRLSFCEHHPMKFIALKDSRILNAITLKCSPELLLHKTTLYSDKNAAKRESIINHNLDFFKSLNFNLFKMNYLDIRQNSELASSYQAEILIPQHIPSSYITNLHAV